MYEGRICSCRFLVGVVLSLVVVTRVSGHIFVMDGLNSVEYEFRSVAYFELAETKWAYDEVLNGRVAVLPSLDLDEIFSDETYNVTFRPFDVPEYDYNDDFEYEQWKDSPKFLLVELGPSSFEASMENVSQAAERLDVDFVVLVVDKDASCRERFVFWWSHKFPGSQTRELISGGGNSTHRHLFLAVGPMQGQAIFELVKKQTYGDISFGFDDTSPIKGRDFVARTGFYVAIIFLIVRWLGNDASRANRGRPSSQSYTRFTGEDLGMGEIQASSSLQDCPICLETMPVGETVRILPCRHVLHHDCIAGWFEQGKYSCPMCKMDLTSHLEEQQRAALEIRRTSRRAWRFCPFGRRIRSLDVDQLIEDTENDEHEGDLELTEESPAVIT